jgi:pimeloyl-ACP methyl ester carboxylesterase
MLDAGWVVVAPDYEGLGGDGLHPYGVGASAGRSMLDAVTAAGDLPAAGVRPTSPVVLLGFSQGGHAAAFAAQMGPVAAPGVDLVGVAVVNPVADVASFLPDAATTPDQFGVAVSVVAGMETTYPGVRLADILAGGAPAAARARALLARDCIGDVVAAFGGDPAQYLGTPVGDLPALGAALAANRTGDVTADTPALEVPALVVQGGLDDIVRPAATADLVERWCAQRAPVEFVALPDAGHGLDATGEVLPWIAGRFAGTNPPDDCVPPS